MTVGEQVDAGEDETALANLCLKDLSQTTVVEIPPLSVAVHIRWEMSQGWMTGIAEKSHRACLLGEVNRTPEYRKELAFEPLYALFLGREQHFLALLQSFECFVDVGSCFTHKRVLAGEKLLLLSFF